MVELYTGIGFIFIVLLIGAAVYYFTKSEKEAPAQKSKSHSNDPKDEEIKKYMKEAQTPFLQIVSHSFITMEKCGLEADDSKDIFCFFSALFYCIYSWFYCTNIRTPVRRISADNMLQAITCWFYIQKNESFMQSYSDYTKSIISKVSHINKYDFLARKYAYAVVASEHLFNYGYSFDYNDIVSTIELFIQDSASSDVLYTNKKENSLKNEQKEELLEKVLSDIGVGQKIQNKILNDFNGFDNHTESSEISKTPISPNIEEYENNPDIFSFEYQEHFLFIVKHTFATLKACKINVDDSSDVFAFFVALYHELFCTFIDISKEEYSSIDAYLVITNSPDLAAKKQAFSKEISKRLPYLKGILDIICAFAVVATEYLLKNDFDFPLTELFTCINQFVVHSVDNNEKDLNIAIDDSQEADQIKEILNIVISKMGVDQIVKEKINNDYIEPYLT